MKPNAGNTVDVQSTMTGMDSGQFTVDQNSLAHIMSVLTNLYADPELAVIREYLTNAYDSHIEAGMVPGTANWRPIEVTTPSHFNKNYVIQDFGLGMDADDLRNIYSKYGASTKRDSNTVVGMLGLGSKSALTYTNSFTIVAVKNGIKTTALIAINEDGVPEFTIISEYKTDEGNGVTIQIPVKDRNSFAGKTREFVQFWQDGLILVDGAEPAKHQHQFVEDIKVTTNGVTMTIPTYRTSTSGYYDAAKSYIVMGNVPYPVDDTYVPDMMKSMKMGFVAYVPIGAVAIVPSREKLQYNALTKNLISSLSNDLVNKILDTIDADIQSSNSHAEAAKKINAVSYEIRNSPRFRNGFSYKGDKFVATISTYNIRVSWDYADRSSESRYNGIDVTQMLNNNALIVTGVAVPTGYTNSNAKVVGTHDRRKARHYASTVGASDDFIMFIEHDPTSPWLADLPRTTIEDIKNVKIPRNPSATPKVKDVPYDFYRYDLSAPNANYGYAGHHNGTQPHNPKSEIYYMSPADLAETRFKRGTSIHELVKQFKDTNIEIALMGKNRYDKFLRQFPNAKPFKVYAEAHVKKMVAGVTNFSLVLDNMGYGEVRFLENADPNKINDPDIVGLINQYKNRGGQDGLKAVNNLIEYLRRAEIRIEAPEPKDFENPLDNYPLVGQIGADYMEHLYVYINAQYENIK